MRSRYRSMGLECPAFRYPGGKAKISAKCLRLLEPRDTFVDVFGGRGNVIFRAMYDGFSARNWWINDFATAKFFLAVRDLDIQLLEGLFITKEFVQALRNTDKEDPLRVVLEPCLTFSGKGWHAGFFTKNLGKSLSSGYVRRLLAAKIMLQRVKITDIDSFSLLESLDQSYCVFLDPPYVGCNPGAYDTNFDYMRLAKILRRAKFSWVLTEYAEHLYTPLLGQPALRLDVYRTMESSVSLTRKIRTECVWTNNPRIARCNSLD